MFGFRSVSIQKRVDFANNLAVMLHSGITVNEALRYIAEQEKSARLRKIFYELKEDLELGTTISEAFEKKRKIFGDIFISFLRAGEVSGRLEENLSFLSSWLERNNELKRAISSAFLYPKIIICGTLILGTLITFFLLPRFVAMFESVNVELPITTKFMLAFMDFTRANWLWILMGIVALIVIYRLALQLEKGKRFAQWLGIRLPILGSIILTYNIAVVSQIFSSLFRSGLTISEVISVAAEGAPTIQYQESIKQIGERIASGVSISEAMSDFPSLYPKNFVNIVYVGEKSGTLDESFLYIADFYSKEVFNKTRNLPALLEPILLVFVGLMVGILAFSVIFPMYKMISELGSSR